MSLVQRQPLFNIKIYMNIITKENTENILWNCPICNDKFILGKVVYMVEKTQMIICQYCTGSLK